MTVKEQHRQAMYLAQEAISARKQGETDRALALNRDAFCLEKKVAMSFLNNETDLLTRAVLFRSAAALAKECQHYPEAQQLIQHGLAGSPPAPIALELEQLDAETAVLRFEQTLKRKEKTHSTAINQLVTGSISRRGFLLFPPDIAAQLGLTGTTSNFRVGKPVRKQRIPTLYLIPTDREQTSAFAVQHVDHGYGIGLAGILAKSGIEYTRGRHTFSVRPVAFDDATPDGFVVQINEPPPSFEVVKRRGRTRMVSLKA